MYIGFKIHFSGVKGKNSGLGIYHRLSLVYTSQNAPFSCVLYKSAITTAAAAGNEAGVSYYQRKQAIAVRKPTMQCIHVSYVCVCVCTGTCGLPFSSHVHKYWIQCRCYLFSSAAYAYTSIYIKSLLPHYSCKVPCELCIIASNSHKISTIFNKIKTSIVSFCCFVSAINVIFLNIILMHIRKLPHISIGLRVSPCTKRKI